MEKIFLRVVNHKKSILICFAIAFVLGLICRNFVGVNYDLTDYLPDETSSTKALKLLEEEYNQGIPKMRVMVPVESIAAAKDTKAKLEAVDGVENVTWLDDQIDITVPLETQEQSVIDNYYKDGNALFGVTIDESKRLNAYDGIKSIVGDSGAMTGTDVSTAIGTESTVKEVGLITVVGVLFGLLVLALTTKAWIEPFIVVLGLIVAVVINMGTNLIFGEISFVTNAAGSILQMAVSLDYSVFLLHRFQEYKGTINEPERAMVKALTSTSTSVTASGLTTIIGFLALTLMRFKIGPDLGLALAKGIVISLICVFTLMPALILTCQKLIKRTAHKSILPPFNKFAGVVSKVTIPLCIIFVLIIVPAYLASNNNTYFYGSSHIFNSNTEYGKDTSKIEGSFGRTETFALMVPKGDLAKEKELASALGERKEITNIISYTNTVGSTIPEEYLDKETLRKLISDRYSRFVITADVVDDTPAAMKMVENLRDIGQKYYGSEYYLAGACPSTYDMKTTVTDDLLKVNLVAIAAVFLVLLFLMKSISLPVILVAAIETAIWINLSIPYFTDTTVFYIAYLLISTIQLGATVDYAILMTDRYKEFRTSLNKKDAMETTISSVTISILTSGSVMTVMGFLMGIFCTHQVISQLGYFLGRGTLCSLFVVLFVLPGLLSGLDGIIQKTTMKTNFKRKQEVRDHAC